MKTDPAHGAEIKLWAAQLTQARVDLGLNQRQLAARLGTQQSTVSAWETGRFVPSLPTLMAWAEAVGRDVVMVRRDAEDIGDDK